jgi:hypothetical protein
VWAPGPALRTHSNCWASKRPSVSAPSNIKAVIGFIPFALSSATIRQIFDPSWPLHDVDAVKWTLRQRVTPAGTVTVAVADVMFTKVRELVLNSSFALVFTTLEMTLAQFVVRTVASALEAPTVAKIAIAAMPISSSVRVLCIFVSPCCPKPLLITTGLRECTPPPRANHPFKLYRCLCAKRKTRLSLQIDTRRRSLTIERKRALHVSPLG